MTLQELKKAMLLAMKEKNVIKKELLSVVIGNIDNKGVLKQEGIDENAVVLEEIVSFKKKLENTKNTFEQNTDEKSKQFLEKTLKEIEVLNEFLPKQLTDTELTKIICAAIEKENFKNKNQVLGFLNKNYKGQFSNEKAKEIVNSLP